MSYIFKSNVWERLSGFSGTGNPTLPGTAQTGGFQTFATAIPSGSTVPYSMRDQVANAWENGIGTFTSGVLTRNPLESSNSGSLVSFSGANTIDVTVEILSPVSVSAGAGSNGLLPALNTSGLLDNSFINWAAPPAIGNTTPNSGAFTTLNSTGLATLASVTISGGTIDGTAIGSTTPSSATFTNLTATGTITFSGASGTITVKTVGAGDISTKAASTSFVNNIFSVPPAIGSTTPAAGSFTTLSASSTVSGTGFNTYLNTRATYQGTSKSPTAPASTTAYTMQGLAGAITPVLTGKVQITINGTITAPTGTTVNNGILYQISFGTGTAPASAAALTGTQAGPIQEFTLFVAATAAADVHIPFSVTAIVSMTVGTAYWLDLAAESVTTASAMGLTNVQITAVEQ